MQFYCPLLEVLHKEGFAEGSYRQENDDIRRQG
jgi:hypothetical protein